MLADIPPGWFDAAPPLGAPTPPLPAAVLPPELLLLDELGAADELGVAELGAADSFPASAPTMPADAATSALGFPETPPFIVALVIPPG